MRGLFSLVGEHEVHVVAVRLDVEHLIVEGLRRNRIEKHSRSVALDCLVAFLRPIGGLDAELDLVVGLVAAEAEPTFAGELEDRRYRIVAQLKHRGIILPGPLASKLEPCAF